MLGAFVIALLQTLAWPTVVFVYILAASKALSAFAAAVSERSDLMREEIRAEAGGEFELDPDREVGTDRNVYEQEYQDRAVTAYVQRAGFSPDA